MQRAAAHFASRTDADEACMVGSAAVKEAQQGKSGIMITLVREEDPDAYRCSTGTVELSRVANVEHKVPAGWIAPSGSYVREMFLDYARPLIMGEVTPVFKNGLPDYVHLQDFDLPELRRRLDSDAASVVK